ncbi:DUF1918 domain-containing protein [Streptomyces bauhiniae]|uniref:DUF1918 domain-containing protein n=1 Tax=Streptomyces TaxID=1883 RepID=UPI001C2E0A1A|nr:MULTISPECIES: DUF1918 domain-containing protein [Streptomyces]MBV1945274.1 DUF1918 domain-containing protein [Streptomyces sp. BV129]WST05132.1 DUF1918 domain-containing protein [Streptomyces sp. NBC_01171]BDH04720.1 hypothetical protein HEK131_19470 [Streptomyces seoulensis]
MRASKGDHLVQHGRVVGQHDQVTEVVEVIGEEGEPPYRVRFEDGHEAIMSPGPDCQVRHHEDETN